MNPSVYEATGEMLSSSNYTIFVRSVEFYSLYNKYGECFYASHITFNIKYSDTQFYITMPMKPEEISDFKRNVYDLAVF